MIYLYLYIIFCYLGYIPFVRWIIKPIAGPPSNTEAAGCWLAAPITVPILFILLITFHGFDLLSEFASYLIGD